MDGGGGENCVPLSSVGGFTTRMGPVESYKIFFCFYIDGKR